MITSRRLVSIALFVAGSASGRQDYTKAKNKGKPEITETTVCQILREPFVYNNKIVKVRAIIDVGSEYSTLTNPKCDGAIWFALPGSSGPPGLMATVETRKSAPKKDAKTSIIHTVPVHLVRDSSYQELERYLQLNVKGRACTDQPPPPSAPPDCTTYRIEASFTGRIDSVSREVHAAHQRRTSADPPDFKGFGHMGLYDAELVMESVEAVMATPD